VARFHILFDRRCSGTPIGLCSVEYREQSDLPPIPDRFSKPIADRHGGVCETIDNEIIFPNRILFDQRSMRIQ